MNTDYDRLNNTNSKPKADVPFEDREYFGLKPRQWKEVAKQTAMAAGMAYRMVKSTARSEKKN